MLSKVQFGTSLLPGTARQTGKSHEHAGVRPSFPPYQNAFPQLHIPERGSYASGKAICFTDLLDKIFPMSADHLASSECLAERTPSTFILY